MSLYLISEVAKKAHLTTDTVRFYEKKGLITPNFRANNQYRYFDEHALKRLIFIKHCRDLGMSLKEIETLIALEQNPKQNCHAVNEIIDLHIEHITNKMKALEIFRTQLSELRESCNIPTTVDHCQILKTLEKAEENE